MIEVKDLTFKYKKNAKNTINDISLEINSGVYGLVGSNGAGKTTLLKIIATLLPFSEGNLEINGLDVKEDLSKIRSQIGYVPQKFEFFEMLSLYEFLYYTYQRIDGKIYRLSILWRKRSVEHNMEVAKGVSNHSLLNYITITSFLS